MSNLRYEELATDIYDSLKTIPRTGWVMLGVPNPETVFDHTVALIHLASEIGSEANLSTAEVDDLQHILEVHDWAEVVTGDIFIPNEDQISYQEKKQVKAKLEREALLKLLEGQAYKDTVVELFDRHEAGSDPMAQLAKEIDKYQALDLALEYEETHDIPLFQEFYDYYKRDWPFNHPSLLGRIDTLVERHQSVSRTN